MMLTTLKTTFYAMLIYVFMPMVSAAPLYSYIIEDNSEKIKNEHARLGSSKTNYFVSFFSFEGKENKPEDSHTFASFIKVLPDGTQITRTISWLPEDYAENMQICIFDSLAQAVGSLLVGTKCSPVKGRNFSLAESLDFYISTGKKFKSFEPKQITAETFEAAERQIQSLNSGKVLYVANDQKTRQRGSAINCIHAVSDIFDERLPKGGLLGTGYTMWGHKATRRVENFFQRNEWIIKNNSGDSDHLVTGH